MQSKTRIWELFIFELFLFLLFLSLSFFLYYYVSLKIEKYQRAHTTKIHSNNQMNMCGCVCIHLHHVRSAPSLSITHAHTIFVLKHIAVVVVVVLFFLSAFISTSVRAYYSKQHVNDSSFGLRGNIELFSVVSLLLLLLMLLSFACMSFSCLVPLCSLSLSSSQILLQFVLPF